MSADESFRVLTVCTGNICRSPAVERLLRREFAQVGADGAFDVASAGTRPLEGCAIEPTMARLLTEDGANTFGFSARRLTKSLVRDADLVLAMTRDHRTRSVQMWPGSLKRTFTLRELTRLARLISPGELDAATGAESGLSERLRALLELAPLHRAQVSPELDDVIDPYMQGDEVFEEVYEQLDHEVRTLVGIVARGLP